MDLSGLTIKERSDGTIRIQDDVIGAYEITFDEINKPGVSNLLTILSALTDTPIDTLVQEFEGRGYGDLKSAVADAVTEFATPYRNRTFELLEERGELESILAKGADRAREVASATLADVYDKVGLV